ncbi:MAG: glycosyl transferase family 90 [Flavisolibacter sp.]
MTRIRKNKLIYYIRNFLVRLVPRTLYEKQLQKKLATISKFDQAVLLDRVNYYNKLETFVPIGSNARALKDIKILERPKAYNFDAYEFTRYFNGNLKVNIFFGDITHVDDHPTIQKSRPINEHNANGVLLKLNRLRHFNFLKDKSGFESKKDMLIGRNAVKQENRIRFMNMYFDHPLCDLGQINTDWGGDLKWLKPKISIAEHLKYKFILCLEGNDVATNLKWVMSSNSLAVMTKPKHETWFMEGRLIPDFHYILIKDDFSDLEEKLNYYIKNTEAAKTIIENANSYIKQFFNKEQEDIISLLVLQKYFYYTSQIEDQNDWSEALKKNKVV